MRLVFAKSKWEMWEDDLDTFCRRVATDGFEATEIYLRTLREPPDEIVDIHRGFGLELVGQILTHGESVDDHLHSLDEQFELVRACAPTLVDLHAGRDIFSFDDNLKIFRRIIEMSAESSFPLLVETHRGRPTYSAVETRRYLEALPELRLTADFSHWMVVHESNLSDQESTLALAVDRSDHVHARVGYEEGPQVPDPRAPEWEGHVARHLEIWKRIVEARRRDGAERLTITPEFGPPLYMHTQPFTNNPLADVWEVNVYMRDLLVRELQD